jgi:HK97 family phage prohead protease
MSKPRIVTRDAFVRDTTAEMIEKRQVEFVISTEAVDTYRTVFKLDGWDLSDYTRNPIVCYQHRANSDDPDNIIGTSTVRVEGSELIGTVTFEPAEINPRAEKIFQKVQSGTLRMASVGANVQTARFGVEENEEDPEVLYFTKQRLMEWSVVSVGSNPDAHKRNAETLEEMRSSLVKEINVELEEIPSFDPTKRSLREAELLINK